MTYVVEIQPPKDARTIAVPVVNSWFIISEKPDVYVVVLKKQKRYYIGSVGCGARRSADVYLSITMRGGIAVPKLKEPRETGTGSVIVGERRLPFAVIRVFNDQYLGLNVDAGGYIILERTNGEWRPSRAKEPEWFLACFENSFSSRVGCAEIEVEPVRGEVVVAGGDEFCCATYSEAAVYVWIRYPSAVVKKKYNYCPYRGDCVDNEKLIEVKLERDEERGASVVEHDYVEVDESDIV